MKKIYFILGAVTLVMTTGCAGPMNTEQQDPVERAIEEQQDLGMTDEMIKQIEADAALESIEKELADAQAMQGDESGITLEELQSGNKVELVDVSGGNASGTAWTTLKGSQTHHRVVAKDMPALDNEYFYEGWLVRNAAAGEFFSTGEMTQQSTGEWMLEYIHEGDVLDHAKVVITLEPDDGDPAPAEHIIEN
jgi:hypothetical protein